ncbi:MAG: DNRLRE domain-containing protein [Candidatus Woesearchaeota archaeon]|nr:DNRLRE domain-containing protein [Candidatus Woesearchaeota archaeon]
MNSIKSRKAAAIEGTLLIALVFLLGFFTFADSYNKESITGAAVSELQTAELSPKKDTFVYELQPTLSKDGRLDLHIGNYKGKIRSMMFFDTRAYSGKEITKIELKVYSYKTIPQESSSEKIIVNAHYITTQWTSAVWKNQPTSEAVVIASAEVGAPGWYTFDLTSSASKITSGKYYGIKLIADDESSEIDKIFYSSEKSQYSPKLLIEYSGNAGEETGTKGTIIRNGSCGWCGGVCQIVSSATKCADVMPKPGYECKTVNNECKAVLLATPTPTPTPSQTPCTKMCGGSYKHCAFNGNTCAIFYIGEGMVPCSTNCTLPPNECNVDADCISKPAVEVLNLTENANNIENSEILLKVNSKNDTLKYGESKQIDIYSATFNAFNYYYDTTIDLGKNKTIILDQYSAAVEISVIGINNDGSAATIKINGELKAVKPYSKYIMGGVTVYIAEIYYYVAPINTGAVRFFLLSSEKGTDYSQKPIIFVTLNKTSYGCTFRSTDFEGNEREFYNCYTNYETETTTPTPTPSQKPCTSEGGIVNSAGCCSGLTKIYALTTTAGCDTLIAGNPGYCTKCGDGICKSPENKCSCPSDCSLTTPTCTDSDSGRNYGIQGSVTLGSNTYTDNCIVAKTASCPPPPAPCPAIPDKYYVVEYYCENNIVKNETHECGTGTTCQNGACKTVTTPTPTPSQTPCTKMCGGSYKHCAFNGNTCAIFYIGEGMVPCSTNCTLPPNECNVDADCVTTCQTGERKCINTNTAAECINSQWQMTQCEIGPCQNGVCRNIPQNCGDGKCAAPLETSENCPVDCIEPTPIRTCASSADTNCIPPKPTATPIRKCIQGTVIGYSSETDACCWGEGIIKIPVSGAQSGPHCYTTDSGELSCVAEPPEFYCTICGDKMCRYPETALNCPVDCAQMSTFGEIGYNIDRFFQTVTA